METLAAGILNLSGEEHGLMVELLESQKAELHVELRHTDNHIFREELKRRLTIIESLLTRLK